MDHNSRGVFIITGILFALLSQSAVSSGKEEQATACSSAIELSGSPMQLTPEVQTTILNWLECEECTYTQLRSVVQLGHGAVPFFAVALERGPSRQKCASYTRLLKTRHTELAQYQHLHLHSDSSTLISEKDYIRVHLSNLVTQYKIQAATALGAIGGPLAERTLRQAEDREPPGVVRLAVQDALKPRLK